jgi:hypothetical protein
MARRLLELLVKGTKPTLLLDFTGRDAALGERLLRLFLEHTGKSTVADRLDSGAASLEDDWQPVPSLSKVQAIVRSSARRSGRRSETADEEADLFSDVFECAFLLQLVPEQDRPADSSNYSFLIHKSYLPELLSRQTSPLVVDVRGGHPELQDGCALDVLQTFVSVKRSLKDATTSTEKTLYVSVPEAHVVPVQGWLLGYPVLYLTNPGAPATCLAHQPLLLVRLATLEGTASKAPLKALSLSPEEPVFHTSFSLPASLSGNRQVNAALCAWARSLLPQQDPDAFPASLPETLRNDWSMLTEQRIHLGTNVLDITTVSLPVVAL